MKSSVLRRHGKIIMTIIGVALMVVFALPAFNSGRDITGDTVGKLNGTRITQADIQYAGFEMQLLKNLYRGPFIEQLGLDERSPTVHWMLLVREAQRYGLGSTGPTFEQIVDELSQGFPPYIPGVSAAEIDQLLHNTSASRDQLTQAFNHLYMIQQLQMFAASMPRPISAIELMGDQELTKVNVAFATLDAAKDVKAGSTFSQEELQKQFNLYKAVVRTAIPTNPADPLPPVPTEIDGHRFPFGYKYPDRVKVEYIKFDRSKLRELIKETVEDYDEAYKYYKEHPNEFKNEGAATAAGTLTTQPAAKSFDEVKKSLVEKQIDARITKLIDRMVERVVAQAGAPWKSAGVDEKGYMNTLPTDKWVSYDKMIDDLSKNRDFLGYKPEHKTLDKEWLDDAALENLPEIGKAMLIAPDRSGDLTFAALATHVHELKDVSPREPLGRLSLQKGTEGPRLRDPLRNVYIYRVTDAAKSEEPKSLDEVRQQVEQDLRLRAAYDREVAAGKDLAAAASKADLVAQAASRNIPVQTVPDFSRLDTELPESIQRINGFVDAAFKLVPATASAASQPAATQPTGVGSTTTLASDNVLRVYAIQLKNIAAAKPEDFAARRGLLLRQPDPTLAVFNQKWFTLEALCDRLHYVPVTPFGNKKTEEG